MIEEPRYYRGIPVRFKKHNSDRVYEGVVRHVETHYSYHGNEPYHQYWVNIEGQRKDTIVGDDRIMGKIE